MFGNICSGGTTPLDFTVGTTSTALLSTLGPHSDQGAKYLRISNLSANYVYLSFGEEAEAEKGLVLAPKGTPGWFVEFNNDNMIYNTLYAISSAAGSKLAVLIGG